MNLEKQVCSLELAKKLKELGVKQESLFYITPNKEIADKKRIEFLADSVPFRLEYYSAFTVAELGLMLPHIITKNDKQYFSYSIPPFSGIDDFAFGYEYDLKNIIEITAETEADTRAKGLIYLLENNLLK